MELRVTVSKSFGRFTLDADVTVSGDRIGLFGISGGGKSTLVKLIAGLEVPDSGIVSLNGEILFDSERQINIPADRRRIGMVFQHPHLFPHLDVRGNLLYGHKRSAPEHRTINFERLVAVLQLEPLLDRGVNNLSGGEQQRVAIGRAVLSNPRLLIMDEPLSALDDTLKFQIIPYLKNVCEQFRIPSLFISHSLMEMRLMAEQVLVVSQGNISQQMSAEQLALARMGQSLVGYINLLELKTPRQTDGLHAYRWGEVELLVSAGNERHEALFELSSKDIIIFRRHPEAISARNLLRCTVTRTFLAGNKLGVELACNGERLIAEVVPQAARELMIETGSELYAAIKASAFRLVM